MFNFLFKTNKWKLTEKQERLGKLLESQGIVSYKKFKEACENREHDKIEAWKKKIVSRRAMGGYGK